MVFYSYNAALQGKHHKLCIEVFFVSNGLTFLLTNLPVNLWDSYHELGSGILWVHIKVKILRKSWRG